MTATDEDVPVASAHAPAPALAPPAIAWSRVRGDLVLAALAVGVFLANLLASLYLPTDGGWGTNRFGGYTLHVLLAFTGLYLVFPPLLFVQDVLQGQAFGASATAGFGWWCTAVLAIALVVRSKLAPAGRRGFYAFLIGAQLAGFMAIHWSTAGH